MTFDPQDFLIIARLLIDEEKYEEARYRTAISRAYYAAHLICKKRLEEIGIKFPVEKDTNRGIIHQRVIDYFTERDNPIGGWLLNLRKNRNNADYVLDHIFKKFGVELLIEEAENAINDAYKLKSPKN